MVNRSSSVSDTSKDAQLNISGQRHKNHELIEIVAEQLANLLFEYCRFRRASGYRGLRKRQMMRGP